MLRLVTPPTSDVITVVEMRDNFSVDITEFDDAFLTWIRSSQDFVENYTRHVLRESTWELTLDEFPADGSPLLIDLYPISEVVAVNYRDTSGTLRTWSASNWRTLLLRDVLNSSATDYPAKLFPRYGKKYPDTLAEPGAVTITLRAGYEEISSGYDVPQLFRQAIVSLVRSWWESRVAEQPFEAHEPEATNVVRDLLSPFVRQLKTTPAFAHML